ncbi:unnamed protein product, partial [Tilletia caries]
LLGYVPSVLQPWSTVQNCPVPSLGDSVLLAGVWLLARLLLCAAHPIEEHCQCVPLCRHGIRPHLPACAIDNDECIFLPIPTGSLLHGTDDVHMDQAQPTMRNRL